MAVRSSSTKYEESQQHNGPPTRSSTPKPTHLTSKGKNPMVKSTYAPSSAVLAPGTRIEVGFKGIWSPGRVTAVSGPATVGETDPIGADGRRRRGSGSAGDDVAYSVVLDGIGPVDEVPAGQIRRLGDGSEPHSPYSEENSSQASTNTSVSSQGGGASQPTSLLSFSLNNFSMGIWGSASGRPTAP